jgi:hypothetical protein
MRMATSVYAPASSAAAPTRTLHLARRAPTSDATSACCGVSGVAVLGAAHLPVVVACSNKL